MPTLFLAYSFTDKKRRSEQNKRADKDLLSLRIISHLFTGNRKEIKLHVEHDCRSEDFSFDEKEDPQFGCTMKSHELRQRSLSMSAADKLPDPYDRGRNVHML